MIPDVPYDVSFKSSTSTLSLLSPPCCTSAHKGEQPISGPSDKPLDLGPTSKVFLALLSAQSILREIVTLESLTQNHCFDIILPSEAQLTGYTPLN